MCIYKILSECKKQFTFKEIAAKKTFVFSENHGLGEETCGCLLGVGGSGKDRKLGLIIHNLE